MLRDLTHTLLLLTGGTFVASAAAPDATFGIHRSTDDGRTWSQVGRGLPADLRVDALGHSGHQQLAGTERGLYVSADNGDTWSRPEHGVPEDVKVFAFATNAGRVHCATTRGVWSSTDHGQTWSPAGTGLARIKVLSLTVLNGWLFAGTDQRGVQVLREPGGTWEDVSPGLPAGAQVFQFAVHDGALFAALYSKGVFRYDVFGKNWVSAGEEWPLRLAAADGVLFSGRNPGGVFTSRDGGSSWIDASQGLPDNAPTWCLANHGSTVLIGTAGRSGLLRFDSARKLWTPSDHGLPPGDSAITLGVTGDSLFVVTISSQPPSRNAESAPAAAGR